MDDNSMSGSPERGFDERRASLSRLLKDRPKRSELAETGVIDDSGMPKTTDFPGFLFLCSESIYGKFSCCCFQICKNF